MLKDAPQSGNSRYSFACALFARALKRLHCLCTHSDETRWLVAAVTHNAKVLHYDTLGHNQPKCVLVCVPD
jgi:hypothetical protein